MWMSQPPTTHWSLAMIAEQSTGGKRVLCSPDVCERSCARNLFNLFVRLCVMASYDRSSAVLSLEVRLQTWRRAERFAR